MVMFCRLLQSKMFYKGDVSRVLPFNKIGCLVTVSHALFLLQYRSRSGIFEKSKVCERLTLEQHLQKGFFFVKYFLYKCCYSGSCSGSVRES